MWYSCAPGEDVLSEPFVVIMKVNSVEAPDTVLGRLELEWDYAFSGLKLGGNDEEDIPNVTVSLPAHTTGTVKVELADPPEGSWTWRSLLSEAVPAALQSLVKPGIRYALEYLGAGTAGSSLYSILSDRFQPLTLGTSYSASSMQGNLAIEYPRPTVEEVMVAMNNLIPQANPCTKRKISRFLAANPCRGIQASQDTCSGDYQVLMMPPGASPTTLQPSGSIQSKPMRK